MILLSRDFESRASTIPPSRLLAFMSHEHSRAYGIARALSIGYTSGVYSVYSIKYAVCDRRELGVSLLRLDTLYPIRDTKY